MSWSRAVSSTHSRGSASRVRRCRSAPAGREAGPRRRQPTAGAALQLVVPELTGVSAVTARVVGRLGQQRGGATPPPGEGGGGVAVGGDVPAGGEHPAPCCVTAPETYTMV